MANGSLARGELTSQSDFDAYPMYVPRFKKPAEALFAQVQEHAGLKEFSAEGAFGRPVPAATMRKRIGGQGDDNLRFTRRMLLILESVCIGNSQVYSDTLEALVCRYISNDITEKQIGRFLLNDVVRFYRTMCVDFEFKTVEQKKPKPWGIRYTKLIFSRKLIYFSGVVMCAELANMPANKKRDRLLELCSQPPIDRLLSCMADDILSALREYDAFLALLDDPTVRRSLANVELLRATHTDKFKEIKDSGHRYSSALVSALKRTYGESNPVHEALLV